MEDTILAFSNASTDQILELTEEQRNVLLFALVGFCGKMIKNFNGLEKVNANLDKLKVLDKLKSGIADISESTTSILGRIQVLESAKIEATELKNRNIACIFWCEDIRIACNIIIIAFLIEFYLNINMRYGEIKTSNRENIRSHRSIL